MDESDLYTAIRTNNLTRLKRLLESGQCSPEGNDSCKFPILIECIIAKHRRTPLLSLSEYQPSHGCNLHTSSDDEDTRRRDLLEIVRGHGADVDVQSELHGLVYDPGYHLLPCVGMTPAMVAARLGFLRCLSLLTQSGADLSLRSVQDRTALDYAVIYKQVDCVKYLAKHVTASVLNRKGAGGFTPLMQAMESEREDCLQCMRHLVEAGAVLEERDGFGRTVLMHAVIKRHLTAATLLLDHGAQIEVTDRFGFNSLMIVARLGDVPDMTLGPVSRDEVSNMMNTAQARNDAIMTLLLERGARVDSYRPDGRTPLVLASNPLVDNHVLRLLECGADPTLSRHLKNALHRAVRDNLVDALRAFVMHGFPPLDCLFRKSLLEILHPHYGQSRFNRFTHMKETALSPLTVALLNNRPDIARYLMTNRFFTRFDVSGLCLDAEVRLTLQEMKATDSLEILDFLSAAPRSLLNLSLVSVSSALSQDFARETPITRHHVGQDGIDLNPWIFTPTFRERVGRLGLPGPLQRTLLHKTPSSSICCRFWSDIPLGEGGRF